MSNSLSFAVLRGPFKVSLVDRDKVGCELGKKSLLWLTSLTLPHTEIIRFGNRVWYSQRFQVDAVVLSFLLYWAGSIKLTENYAACPSCQLNLLPAWFLLSHHLLFESETINYLTVVACSCLAEEKGTSPQDYRYYLRMWANEKESKKETIKDLPKMSQVRSECEGLQLDDWQLSGEFRTICSHSASILSLHLQIDSWSGLVSFRCL